MIDPALLLRPDRGEDAGSITLLDKWGFDSWISSLTATQRALVRAARFAAEPGSTVLIPAKADRISAAVGVADLASPDPWTLAAAAKALPAGSYRLAGDALGDLALGWILGQYRFDRYRKCEEFEPRILLIRDVARIERDVALAGAVALVRDLVNTPAADMGPEQIEAEISAVAEAYGGKLKVTRGDALTREFPLVAAVGRAAGKSHAPRFIELEWGNPHHPRVAIVGKGISFDTGGLDIKPAAGMRLMKKDMGGAAHALALAGLVMAARLPIRLQLLVPAAENAISGESFRPGDIIASRLGPTVEIHNTDAEGRLLLADALARAGEDDPALILDFATLTGAARIALGPELPALFSDDEELVAALLRHGDARRDPLWRLPLWAGYEEMLKSDVADVANAADGSFAGAVTAALFLKRFVPAGVAWAHIDTFAWMPSDKPGRPKGGEALGLRAVWAMLEQRFGQRR